MTRHAVYAMTANPNGRVPRYPFASMSTEAARRYVAAHPEARLRFVPPLPPEDVEDPEDSHPDYAWEADYRAHSSSHTGLYEAP